MSWNHTEWLKNNFEPRMNFYFGTKTVRTRNKKGRFVKDDPKTMQNEAFKSDKINNSVVLKSKSKNKGQALGLSGKFYKKESYDNYRDNYDRIFNKSK